MKRDLLATVFTVVVFLALGVVVVVATPAQQEALTTDQQLILTVESLQTVDAMLWGTLDSYSISTQVATLISTPVPTNTARPTSTPSSTNTRTPTDSSVFATPTQEVLQGTFTPTATFFSATNTHTPTRTPTAGATLPTMTYAVNVGSVDRNVRVCPDLSCEVVAVVRVGETVVIDLSQRTESGNYIWYSLWNSSFEAPAWVSTERIDPYLRYLQW